VVECKQIWPLLFPYLEREAEPAEAIDVANHLSNCTACKILMARKHRLGQMLEDGLSDRIPVGDDFVRSVMANLPEGPPPRGKLRKKGKRRFDLAVLFGVAVAVTQVVAARIPRGSMGAPDIEMPALALPSADGLVPGFEMALRLVATAASSLVGGAAIELTALPLAGAFLLALLIGFSTLFLLGGSAVLTLAATSLKRQR